MRFIQCLCFWSKSMALTSHKSLGVSTHKDAVQEVVEVVVGSRLSQELSFEISSKLKLWAVKITLFH